MSLKNIVDAFGNIIEEQLHCTEDSHGLMCPEDKIKLANIEDGANKYIHPDTHPATIIEQDADHRLVTDNEKNTWNAKASTDLVSETAHGLMSKDDKIKLNSLENYEHPSSHDASIITQDSMHRFVTDAEKESWNNMTSIGSATETANGLMSKEDKAKLNSLENYTHPETHSAEMIVQDTTHRFVSDTQISNWSNKASTDVVTTTSNGLMSSDDKTKLNSLQNYTHPATHPATMITQDSTHRFVTDEEKTTWNNKGSNYTHPDTHPATMITQDSTHRFVTDSEKTTWNNSAPLAKLNSYFGVSDDDIIKIHFPHRIFDGGDCFIIETKDKNIMIDFGVDGSQTELIKYLKTNGLTKIDCFIISHYHADHIGSVNVIRDVLNSSEINTSSAVFYLPHGLMDWDKCIDSQNTIATIRGYETQIRNLLLTTGNNWEKPTEGQTLAIGECVLKFINLTESDFNSYYSCCTQWNYNEAAYTTYNNFSMVVQLTYRKHNFLFTGDIEELAQSKIYNRINKPDVLKIEHHCCNYGTFEGYGRLLEPEVAVIGEFESGVDETMRRSTYAIVQNCADVYSNNVSGNIVVSSTGFDIFTESDNGKINYKDSVTLTSGSGIRPGTDLNNMFTPGEYFSQSEARTKTILNTPENGSGFKLIIEHLSIGTTSTRQTYIATNMRNCNIYTRTSYKGVYYDWVCMTPNSEGIKLVNYDDLNKCLLRSDYVCSNGSDSLVTNISNIPPSLDSGFKLINHQISEKAFKQILLPNNMSNGNFYIRSYIDNKFSEWFTIKSDQTEEKEAKELWDGTWSSGGLTVADAQKYRVLLLVLSGKNTMIPVFQYNGSLRGVGGFPSTTTKDNKTYNTLTTYQIDATYTKGTDSEGNTANIYTMNTCNSIDHVVDYLGTSTYGPNTNISSLTVKKIIGLLYFEESL